MDEYEKLVIEIKGERALVLLKSFLSTWLVDEVNLDNLISNGFVFKVPGGEMRFHVNFIDGEGDDEED